MDNLNFAYELNAKLFEAIKPILVIREQTQQILLQNQSMIKSWSESIIATQQILKSTIEPFLETRNAIESMAKSIVKNPVLLDVYNNYNLIADKIDYFQVANPDLTSDPINDIIDSLSNQLESDSATFEETKIDDSIPQKLDINMCITHVVKLKISQTNENKTVDIHKWIGTIGMIITVIFTLLGYYKVNHDIEYLKMLEKINYHLEQIQSESGK